MNDQKITYAVEALDDDHFIMDGGHPHVRKTATIVRMVPAALKQECSSLIKSGFYVGTKCTCLLKYIKTAVRGEDSTVHSFPDTTLLRAVAYHKQVLTDPLATPHSSRHDSP
jgi:hypothetical protein